jgi:hypothetical protein
MKESQKREKWSNKQEREIGRWKEERKLNIEIPSKKGERMKNVNKKGQVRFLTNCFDFRIVFSAIVVKRRSVQYRYVTFRSTYCNYVHTCRHHTAMARRAAVHTSQRSLHTGEGCHQRASAMRYADQEYVARSNKKGNTVSYLIQLNSPRPICARFVLISSA